MVKTSDESTAPIRTGHRRYVELAQSLLSAIIRGDYREGDRLPPDREIAARHGVSRPTAREAFLALELIGAIEVRHGDGVYVSGVGARFGGTKGSPLDAPPRELIEARRLIEPMVAQLAARRIGKEAVEALSRDVDEAAGLAGDPDQLPRFVALGLEFHAGLAPACNNALMSGIVCQFVDAERHPLWILVNQQAMRHQATREAQVLEHRAIINAVASGDSAAAEQAMRSHLERLSGTIFYPAPVRADAAGDG